MVDGADPTLHDHGGEPKLTTTSEMRGEVIPLAVDQDAVEVEYTLGAIATPSYARTVEAHAAHARGCGRRSSRLAKRSMPGC